MVRKKKSRWILLPAAMCLMVALAISGFAQGGAQCALVVAVAATYATVQLAAPTTGETLEADTIGRLPLSTPNFLTLLSLSAGTNGELFDSANIGRGQVSMNVNGQRPANNNYQLEGINANDINLPTFDNGPLPNPQTFARLKTQRSLSYPSQ